MKLTGIITIFLCVIFYSCEKDSETLKEELYLYAKVENALEYSNVVAVKLMTRDRSGNDIELVRGDWKDNGFAIALPKINRNNYRELINMKLLPEYIVENLATITTNNKNARSGIADFLGVDKEGNMVTQFFPCKIDEDGNEVKVDFKYVNSDVIISGYIEAGTWATDFDEETGATSNWAWESHTIFSIEYKDGWNASSHSSFQSSEGKTTNKLSIIPTGSNLKWYGGESL